MKALLLILCFLTINVSLLYAADRETGDYNFDGHEDYREYRESNGKEHYYDFYLYNPLTKKYVYSDELSGLCNPSFDSSKKEIHCIWPGGHSGALYSEEDYKWQGKHLVLIRVITQTDVDFQDGKSHFVRVIATIEDGKPCIQSIEPVITPNE